MAGAKGIALAFVITVENKSKEYQLLKSEISTIAEFEDIFYAEKRYDGKNLSAKLDSGMKDCHILLVFCNPTLKKFLDEKKGDSSCILKKDEKSTIEKGFKKHKKKLILIQYTDDNEEDIKPKCLSDHPIHNASDTAGIEVLKSKVEQKLTQANISFKK